MYHTCPGKHARYSMCSSAHVKRNELAYAGATVWTELRAEGAPSSSKTACYDSFLLSCNIEYIPQHIGSNHSACVLTDLDPIMPADTAAMASV